MQVNIQELTNQFSKSSFHIINVRRAVIAPGSKYFGTTTPPSSGFIFPLNGKARMFFNHTPYEMAQGKIFHFAPNMSLDKEVIGEDYWDYIVVQYEFKRTSSPLYSPYHYETDIRFTPLVHELILQLYLYCAVPQQFVNSKARELFRNILTEMSIHEKTSKQEKGHRIIEQAAHFITMHYMTPITIPKLAEQHNLKPKQFAYLFHKYTGVSPNEYLINQRIHRAHELLIHTTRSIAEVSACVGYTDPYYFSRLFKKRTGFPPSILRSSKLAQAQ